MWCDNENDIVKKKIKKIRKIKKRIKIQCDVDIENGVVKKKIKKIRKSKKEWIYNEMWIKKTMSSR